MIACDTCDGWFHGTCVNISKRRANFIESYICPTCQNKTGAEIQYKNNKKPKSTPEKPVQNTQVAATAHPKPPPPFAEICKLDDEEAEMRKDESRPKEYDHLFIQTAHLVRTCTACTAEIDYLDEYSSLIDRQPKQKKRKSDVAKADLNDLVDKSIGKSNATATIKSYKSGKYINCDVRYFNFASLGKFDVVLVDPPVRNNYILLIDVYSGVLPVQTVTEQIAICSAIVCVPQFTV